MRETLAGHKAQVSCLRFIPGPDPQRRQPFLSGDESGQLLIWLPRGESSYRIAHSVPAAHQGSVGALGCVWVDEVVYVITGGADACVRVWKWTRAREDDGGESPSCGVLNSGWGSYRARAEVSNIRTIDLHGRLALDIALHRLPGSSGTSHG